MDNRQRVIAARKAMEAHDISKNGSPSKFGMEDGVVDLLTDMMHLCRKFDKKFDLLLNVARLHYEGETSKSQGSSAEALEVPEINRELIVSTCHITEGAATEMDNLAGEDSAMEVSPGVYLDPINYGYRLRISEDRMMGLADDEEVELDGEDLESVDAVVALAIQYGCNRVIIDRDGPEMYGVKKYDW